ncbi:MAG: hypothetical protein ACNI26_14585 [Terasakiella sp.]|uniref:hypothetical protein n=1 Tax=unclassified Terasakiella TaxID=2614952 RepID=UPI003B00FCEA
MDLAQRRSLIATKDNPNRVNDYVITFQITCTRTARRLRLRYVPDKVIIDTAKIDAYFAQLFDLPDYSLEQTANALLEDMNNELVARWIQVFAEEEPHQTITLTIVIEDRQPQWDNPHLLVRISTI